MAFSGEVADCNKINIPPTPYVDIKANFKGTKTQWFLFLGNYTLIKTYL